MIRRGRTWACLARLLAPLLLTTGAPGLAAQATRARPPEDGERAPAGRWYTRGGCASRSGLSDSEPVRRDPELAWTVDLRGTIESEPLVWDGKAVVAVRQSGLRRQLHVLDLASGRVLFSQALPATRPLAPSMWGDVIAVHPAPERVELFRIAGHRLMPLRSFRSTSTLSDPLLFEQELYLRDGIELVRYDLSSNAPVWRAVPQGAFRGTPALRGELVYGVWYEPSGSAHLVSLRRADGQIVDHVPAGHHGGEIPAEDAELEVLVLRDEVFLRYPLRVVGSNGGEHDTVGVRRVDGRLQATASGPSGISVQSFTCAPVQWEGGWIARQLDAQGQPVWVAGQRLDAALQSLVLADAESHPELLAASAPPSAARDVLYLGPLAADAADFTVCWKAGGKAQRPLLRPVPVDGALLVVTAPGVLAALRAPPAEQSQAELAAERAAAALQAELAESYAALALKSLRTNDLDLAARLIAEAERLGAASRSLDSARVGLERMAGGSRAPVPDPSRVAALEQEEREIADRPGAELAALARRVNEPEVRFVLLRKVLSADPEHAAARALVREMLPAEAPVTSPFDAPSWLEFLAAQATMPVRILAPTDGGGSSPEEALLAREAGAWRPDLSGYQSARLFVVTPPGRPGAVAQALRVGELTCDTLEEIFAELGPRRGAARELAPLPLLLYETQAEYVEQSQRERSLPEIARGWMAGHFSPGENLSRMFVPEDEDSVERLLEVYAHELTHHWLATRAPFTGTTDKAISRGGQGDADLPGYWVAEGFATLVEEFALDPARGSWSPENPRAESLDTLASARETQLVPWERVFTTSKRSFAELGTDLDRPVTLAWRLGVRAGKSEMHFFYAQAGAACHYLFRGAGPEMRTRLLRYVRAWYEGDERGLDVHTAFGLSAEELGRETLAFARRAR